MAYEINITGEIIPYDGYQGYYCSAQLDRELEKANGEDLIVNINSCGGDVDEGFMMYVALRKYAAKHEVKVTTYAKGRCYSIATVIFLAGDTRIANRYLSPFIHNAWAYTVGDANQLLKDAADLEMVNKKIGLFYAEHTALTYEEAREWMNADTFIDPEECVRIRFATEVEEIVRPAALLKTLNKNLNKKPKMSKNNKDKGLFAKLAKVFNSLDAENSVEFNTATNQAVVFPELEDGQEPSIGDYAEIDGAAADGEVLMADGRTFVFENGNLTEIREKEVEETETTMEELQAENQRLREQLETQNSRIEELVTTVGTLSTTVTTLNSNFNKLGTIISEYSPAEDDNNPDRTKGANPGNNNNPIKTTNLMENYRKHKNK